MAEGAAPARASIAGVAGLFLTSLGVGFSGALMPGPLLSVVIGGSAGQGFWMGPLLVAGHGIAELALLLTFAWGLGAALKRPAVTRAIAGIGAAVLLWMAWGMISGALARTVLAQPEGALTSSLAWPVAQGALVSVTNPYWVLWWATVGASYVALSLQRGRAGLTAFFAGHILSDLSWYSLVSVLVASGRRWLDPDVYRYVILGSGLFLVAMSVYFARAALFPEGRR